MTIYKNWLAWRQIMDKVTSHPNYNAYTQNQRSLATLLKMMRFIQGEMGHTNYMTWHNTEKAIANYKKEQVAKRDCYLRQVKQKFDDVDKWQNEIDRLETALMNAKKNLASCERDILPHERKIAEQENLFDSRQFI